MKKFSLKVFIALFLLSLPLLVSCNGECSHKNIELSTYKADCDSEGYTLHSCPDCGFEYRTDVTPSKGHSFAKDIFAPTCTEQGYTYYTCECGYSYKTDFVVPTSHTLSIEVVAPNCTNQGYTKYSCACGYSFNSAFISPQGHTLSAQIYSPTCTEQGYTENKCSVCDYSFVSEYTKPKGHSFTTETLRPTSSSTGFTKFRCECGYEYTGDYVMASDIFKGAYVDGEEVLAHGVDISSWNGAINWEELKASGIDFVIIKAGSSRGKDTTFEENYKNAKAAGLDVGCYFYTYATTVAQIESDAQSFLGWIADKKFEYPVYLDIEEPSQELLGRELLTEMCKVFIEKLQSEGYFCGLYTNSNWLLNFLNPEKVTVYFDVWLARWTSSGSAEWSESFGERMGLWQYTSTAKIGTHTCDFDLNVAFKNYPEWIKKWGFNGY